MPIKFIRRKPPEELTPEEAQQRMRKIFTGQTLNGYIEATKVTPLTEFQKTEEEKLTKGKKAKAGWSVEITKTEYAKGKEEEKKEFGEYPPRDPRRRCACLGGEVAGFAEAIKSSVTKEWWAEAQSMTENMLNYVLQLREECNVDVQGEYDKLLRSVLRKDRNESIENAAGVSLATCGIRGPFAFTEEQVRRAGEFTRASEAGIPP